MIDYKYIDKKIMAGYDYLKKGNSVNACDTWEGIKSAIIELQAKNINDLQAKYTWSEFLENYIQELAFELHNAGI